MCISHPSLDSYRIASEARPARAQAHPGSSGRVEAGHMPGSRDGRSSGPIPKAPGSGSEMGREIDRSPDVPLSHYPLGFLLLPILSLARVDLLRPASPTKGLQACLRIPQREYQCAPKRHYLPQAVGGSLSTLEGLVVTTSSGSLGHQSRDASSRLTSTILPSPDTTDRHPFYVTRIMMAGWLSNYGRKVGHGFAHCSEQLAQIGKLGMNAIIGHLIEPSLHPRCRVASLANVLVYLATLDIQSCLWPSFSPSRRAIAHGLRTREKGYCARFSSGPTNVESREVHWEMLVPERLYQVRGMNLPSVSENAGNSPREYLACCVAYGCVSLAISATMVPGLRSGISVLFPSVRACRTRGFSTRSKGTDHATMGSVVGKQQEKEMSLINPCRFPRHNCAFVHAFACLCGNRRQGILAQRVFRK
ncbi:hypothetical protein EDB85DRAFT_1892868 [Lactarius pseudohatsudake]|nr:hypothetical protein EDB85DRAFT_1892868 [Lactarius pseudohatsudake]